MNRCKILLAVLAVSFMVLPAQAITCSTDLCKIDVGTSQIIEKWGVCKQIDNASGVAVLLPSKTCPELKAFVDHAPTNIAGLTISDVTCTGGTYDPCNAKALGTVTGGVLSVANNCVATANIMCGGTFRSNKYMLTPGHCSNSATPTCTNASDNLNKKWKGGAGSANTHVVGVENIDDTAASTASTIDGDVATAAMVASPYIAADSAAHYCSDMVYGGYSDWYLPAKSELVYMFCNSSSSGNKMPSYPQELTTCAGIYGGPTTALGGFASSGFYWASTENNLGSGQAWNISMDNGGLGTSGMAKSTSSLVRCIRKY